METLEEFFKNRISFTTNKNQDPEGKTRTKYGSKVFKPEDYDIDFLRKIIPFCYHILSGLGANKCKYFKWESFKLEIVLFVKKANKDAENDEDDENDEYYYFNTRSIIYNTILIDDCRFLLSVNSIIDNLKSEGYHLIPSKPFWFQLKIYRNEVNKELIINTGQTFKSNECVICLIKEPNILFCNCGHLFLCEECDEEHSVSLINSSCIFCDNVVTNYLSCL